MRMEEGAARIVGSEASDGLLVEGDEGAKVYRGVLGFYRGRRRRALNETARESGRIKRVM